VLIKDVLIFTLFAASLHFIMGVGGMASFGHAAYFGLGRLWRGAAEHHGRLGMMALAPARPVVAGLGAALVGWFCVRRSGVYFAMLTLAAAQIVWSTAYQWYEVTGGDDGILGVWPRAGLLARGVLLSGAGCASAASAARRMAHSPFGYTLRGGRDSAARADAIGIDLQAPAMDGLRHRRRVLRAGRGVYVFSKGSDLPRRAGDPAQLRRAADGAARRRADADRARSSGRRLVPLLEDAIFRLEYWRAIVFGL
jgi:branched-chain amino acid transport system permease protein